MWVSKHVHVDYALYEIAFIRRCSQVRSLGEADAPSLSAGFSWCWRFTWDGVHGKLTGRKPFLCCDTDIKLSAKKPIRVTKTG